MLAYVLMPWVVAAVVMMWIIAYGLRRDGTLGWCDMILADLLAVGTMMPIIALWLAGRI